MIGRTLSHYKVLEKIGEGGMGEVYLAKDTKLDREVAVKVLPATFSENKERLARFEREARLLASLNHPNIAAIHELEESDGVHFLALEYVPGETLAERIKRGPIPVDDALPLFKQIAEGLEAAHEKGVIHRDLKPANIKVTPEGKVKVLDFGLAKAMAGETPVQGLSESPTITREHTEAGVLLGTAPYMSPEQARGKAVDKRTDIWAFGCCLYEALTGRKVFEGETVSDTISAILRSEPEWEPLPRDTPLGIGALLRRCLHKDTNRRLRDAWDARVELEEASTETTVQVMAVSGLREPQRRIPFLLTVLLAAFLGAVTTWGVIRYTLSTPPTTARVAINLPPDQQLSVWGSFSPIALSPDGKHLAYIAASAGEGPSLYLRALDEFDAKPVPGTAGAVSPFFSPDGHWLGFFADGELQKVPVDGGTPSTICHYPNPLGGQGASWGPDDTIIFAPTMSGKGLVRVPAGGGEPEVLTEPKTAEREEGHRWPQVLPGGKAVIFTVWSAEEWRVAALSLETGEWHTVLREAAAARYVATGHLLYMQSGILQASPFDLESLQNSGSPTPILENVYVSPNSDHAYFTVSQTGALAYVVGHPETSLQWVDRQGVARPLTETSRQYLPHPRLSADGQRLVVAMSDMTARSDIWSLELARGAWTRLTFDSANEKPLWSPDGKRVIFGSNRDGGTWNIFSMLADGSGETEQLTSGAYRIPTSLSSDGKTLIFRQRGENTTWDVGMLRLAGEREPEILLATPFNEHNGMISPDGGWLAYTSDESGRDEVYVQPFPGPGSKWSISPTGGKEPLWSRDGKELFYRNDRKMMAVPISLDPDFAPGIPTLLFEGDYLESTDLGGPSSNYDVTEDGEAFIMIGHDPSSVPTEVHIVLNWFEELKRLVPTN